MYSDSYTQTVYNETYAARFSAYMEIGYTVDDASEIADVEATAAADRYNATGQR